MEDEKKEVVVEQEVQKTEVEILQEKAQQAEDKYVRLFAEFDNYKKRIQREKDDLITNTKVRMLTSILDMDNDLSFAIKSSGEISEGMTLILSKLETFLKSQGVETIQTETYDEDLHEVISIITCDEEKVFDVVSKGYTLNGKPFRYPKIILGKNA
jgi:molecular chaperone GrpE